MIKEFKNIRERSERTKFLCLGYKTNNWRIGKKTRPQKRQLDKILGPQARPLRPHFRRLCQLIVNSSILLQYLFLKPKMLILFQKRLKTVLFSSKSTGNQKRSSRFS